jgi:hypothetical protein
MHGMENVKSETKMFIIKHFTIHFIHFLVCT